MIRASRAVTPLAEGVWRVEDADGRKIVVKHQLFGRLTRGRAYDLLEVEREVLDILRAAECPVPAFLGADPDAQCIFLQWVGDRLLDDAIQDGDHAATMPAIRGLCAIERACAPRADQLAAAGRAECQPRCPRRRVGRGRGAGTRWNRAVVRPSPAACGRGDAVAARSHSRLAGGATGRAGQRRLQRAQRSGRAGGNARLLPRICQNRLGLDGTALDAVYY